MTDLTLGTRPLIPFLQDWLSNHANAINDFGKSVGVASPLIVAGPIQEASTIISSSIQFFPDEAGGSFQNVVQERGYDWLIDNVLMPRFSSDEIAADYAARSSDLLHDISATPWQKVVDPTGNDVGYMNLNVGTAIYYLQNFLANPANYLADPQNASQDPLTQLLQQYADPLDQTKINNDALSNFVSDIINPDKDAGWAISALVAKQAVNDFSSLYGPNFTNASEASQAAYVASS